MASFDHEITGRRQMMRRVAETAEKLPSTSASLPAEPVVPAAPGLGEFAPVTFTLVYLECCPGGYVTGPDLDPEFEFDPFLDRHLPEPFRSAAIVLGRGAPGEYSCWCCGREPVGWHETADEGPRGEEIDGVGWAACGLLIEGGSGKPVNVLCEMCCPAVEHTPIQLATTTLLKGLEVKGS